LFHFFSVHVFIGTLKTPHKCFCTERFFPSAPIQSPFAKLKSKLNKKKKKSTPPMTRTGTEAPRQPELRQRARAVNVTTWDGRAALCQRDSCKGRPEGNVHRDSVPMYFFFAITAVTIMDN